MPEKPLSGRVALVTGAAHRVGRAIALELARAGADVAVHYHASAEAARETAALIAEMGRESAVFESDLSRPDDIGALVAAFQRRFSRLDILVNSAAAFERRKIVDMDPGSWDAMLALNLRAPALMSRAAVPVMKRGGGGVIINIADVAGFRPWANHLHYSVSKAGLLHMTACLAMELAPDIRVNAVAPGTVLPAAFQTEKELATTLKRTPLKTPGSAEDVGEAVVFLAGARAITGQVIAVDGGRALNTAGDEQWEM